MLLFKSGSFWAGATQHEWVMWIFMVALGMFVVGMTRGAGRMSVCEYSRLWR
jgi:hypothetical protein